jgi:pSer/pThr/pTyr-binding forkhead associated (FHA) protein/enamine deaminase RidA (YjgF/YER057c/UK114 family)
MCQSCSRAGDSRSEREAAEQAARLRRQQLSKTILIEPFCEAPDEAGERDDRLLVLNGPLQGREFVVVGKRCLVGSGAGNDIIIDDPTISRQHCEICLTPGGHVLRDMDSTNGTIVEGVRIAEAYIDYGTEFRLGKTRFVLCRPDEVDACLRRHLAAAGRGSGEGLAVQKFTSHGIGYSLAEWNDVRHVFAAAVPQRGGTLREQADDALRIIETVSGVHGARGSIVHQAVYVADPDQIPECRAIIRDFYGDELPCTSYIPQAPCEGKQLAIEAIGLGRGAAGRVDIERVSEELVLVRHSGMTWAHAAPSTGDDVSDNAYEQGTAAFRRLEALLGRAGMRTDQVVRTWLYQGGIVAGEGATQRYKELNRARSDIYNGLSFLGDLLPPGHPGGVYPASTGIGADGRRLDISAIALASDRTDVVVVPLENPRQVPAFRYGPHHSPKSPKFSRAMAVACGDYGMIFISGTASIVQSETRHVGDVGAQTEETLDNIAALISAGNLERHGLPGLGADLGGIGLARVYIKRREHYEQVRAVCERRLGELPTVYAVADICRPDLLVEIEGIALSRRGGAA